MRLVQNINTPGRGQRVAAVTGGADATFKWESEGDIAADQLLVAFANQLDLVTGIYGDGSQQGVVLPASPVVKQDAQWWFELDGGVVPKLMMHLGGVDYLIGTAATSSISAVTAGIGLTGGGSSGSVTLSVDFSAVAHASHLHAEYADLDGSSPFTGAITVPTGAASAVSVAMGASNTGIYADGTGIGLSFAGTARFYAGTSGIVIGGNYRLPYTAPSPGQTLIAGAGGIVSWGNLSSIGMTKPYRSAPSTAVGYNFADDATTGFTADASSLYFVLSGVTLGRADASGWVIGDLAATGYRLPIARGTQGQTLIMPASGGVLTWGVPRPVKSAPGSGAGFSFSDDLTTNLTSDGTSLVLTIAGVSNLSVTATGIVVGSGGTKYTIPVATGAAGQALVMGASAIMGWSDVVKITGGVAVFGDLPTTGYSLPLVRGTVGQVPMQGAAGVVTWQDVATVINNNTDQSYTRLFLLGMN